MANENTDRDAQLSCQIQEKFSANQQTPKFMIKRTHGGGKWSLLSKSFILAVALCCAGLLQTDSEALIATSISF